MRTSGNQESGFDATGKAGELVTAPRESCHPAAASHGIETSVSAPAEAARKNRGRGDARSPIALSAGVVLAHGSGMGTIMTLSQGADLCLTVTGNPISGWIAYGIF